MEMKPALSVGFVALMGSLVSCDATPTTFTSAEGQFSVLLPKAPQLFGPDTSGSREVSRLVAAEGDGAMYSVVYTDYPVAPVDAARFLLDQRDAQLKQAPGKIVLERPLALGGIPGLELRVEYPEGVVGHSRMYVRGSRLYHQSAFGYPDRVFASQFFESFALK